MGKSNEIFKPWAPAPDIVNWYRNALDRDPDLEGLQFWNDMYKRSGAEVTWNAFRAVSASFGVVIAMSREEASQPAEEGNNFTVVDEWFRNYKLVGDPQPYMLMMSNGMSVQSVFDQFCQDYGVDGDWLEASKLK